MKIVEKGFFRVKFDAFGSNSPSRIYVVADDYNEVLEILKGLKDMSNIDLDDVGNIKKITDYHTYYNKDESK